MVLIKKARNCKLLVFYLDSTNSPVSVAWPVIVFSWTVYTFKRLPHEAFKSWRSATFCITSINSCGQLLSWSLQKIGANSNWLGATSLWRAFYWYTKQHTFLLKISHIVRARRNSTKIMIICPGVMSKQCSSCHH
jgi:hypothetical protein